MSGFILFAAAWLVLFALVMCVFIAGARAEEAEFIDHLSEINTPSQLAHSQPGSISERAGKGDGFDHEPTIATGMDSNHV